ncbi:MAG TPA: hypothetical protein VN081_03325 [Dongiaceae bacterium]|nr:hypothetical protein [Dongiaceae bacterium]
MTTTEFSTIIRLFAEQNKYIDKRFDEQNKLLDKRFTHIDKRLEQINKRFEQEEKKRISEHFAVMHALEKPFLDHDARITKLEKAIVNNHQS